MDLGSTAGGATEVRPAAHEEREVVYQPGMPQIRGREAQRSR